MKYYVPIIYVDERFHIGFDVIHDIKKIKKKISSFFLGQRGGRVEVFGMVGVFHDLFN